MKWYICNYIFGGHIFNNISSEPNANIFARDLLWSETKMSSFLDNDQDLLGISIVCILSYHLLFVTYHRNLGLKRPPKQCLLVWVHLLNFGSGDYLSKSELSLSRYIKHAKGCWKLCVHGLVKVGHEFLHLGPTSPSFYRGTSLNTGCFLHWASP